MRCKILIYLLIIAGFITSCTRDSTELPSNNKLIETKLSIGIAPLEITEEPLTNKALTKANKNNDSQIQITESLLNEEVSGGGASVIGNSEFKDAKIGIQITNNETKEVIAAGLFCVNDNLKDLVLNLKIGVSYTIEATMVDKCEKTNIISFKGISAGNDWNSSGDTFADLSDFEFNSRTYYCKDENFTLSKNNTDIPINLKCSFFAIEYDIHYLPGGLTRVKVGTNSVELFNNQKSDPKNPITSTSFYSVDKNTNSDKYTNIQLEAVYNNTSVIKKYISDNERAFIIGKKTKIKCDVCADKKYNWCIKVEWPYYLNDERWGGGNRQFLLQCGYPGQDDNNIAYCSYTISNNARCYYYYYMLNRMNDHDKKLHNDIDYTVEVADNIKTSTGDVVGFMFYPNFDDYKPKYDFTPVIVRNINVPEDTHTFRLGQVPILSQENNYFYSQTVVKRENPMETKREIEKDGRTYYKVYIHDFIYANKIRVEPERRKNLYLEVTAVGAPTYGFYHKVEFNLDNWEEDLILIVRYYDCKVYCINKDGTKENFEKWRVSAW